MINSNDYYTESNVMLLFGYTQKSTVRKWREKVNTICISNRWYYLRSDIDKKLNEKFSGEEGQTYLEIAKQYIENHNLDFERFVPMRKALEILEVSRQRLYQLCDADRIEWVMYDGFRLFDKEKLEQRNAPN